LYGSVTKNPTSSRINVCRINVSRINVCRINVFRIIVLEPDGRSHDDPSSYTELQGDQIGRIFAHWVIVYFGQLF
jgi:hypothetical protein